MSEYVPDKRAKHKRVEQVTLPDGREGWKYTDGSIRDEKGSLMAPHPDGAPPITAANSTYLRELRSMKHAQAAAAGILASARTNVSTNKVPGSLHAWKFATKHLADVFWHQDTKPRDKAEIYKALALALDAIPARVPAASSQPAGAQFDTEDMRLLRFILSRVRVAIANKKAGQPAGFVEG